jgi:hypothetical protein
LEFANLPKGKALPKIAIEFGLLTGSQKQNMIRRPYPPADGISSRQDQLNFSGGVGDAD